jgi:hypothetical protein
MFGHKEYEKEMSPLRQFLYFDVGKKRVSRKAAKAQAG